MDGVVDSYKISFSPNLRPITLVSLQKPRIRMNTDPFCHIITIWMHKVYWILALALLMGTGWNYAIRITTIDYLNRYQNSQQSQFNDQGSSTSNQNNNSQNSKNQNSNSQSQSTSGG